MSTKVEMTGHSKALFFPLLSLHLSFSVSLFVFDIPLSLPSVPHLSHASISVSFSRSFPSPSFSSPPFFFSHSSSFTLSTLLLSLFSPSSTSPHQERNLSPKGRTRIESEPTNWAKRLHMEPANHRAMKDVSDLKLCMLKSES